MNSKVRISWLNLPSLKTILRDFKVHHPLWLPSPFTDHLVNELTTALLGDLEEKVNAPLKGYLTTRKTRPTLQTSS